MRGVRLVVLTSLVLVAGAVVSVPAARTLRQPAGRSFVAAGPCTYEREGGAPRTVATPFAVANPNAEYLLRITNSGLSGEFGRVSSAVISLNGAEVARPNDFNQNVGKIEKPVTLRAESANQPVTGTAVDQAGQTATARITINLDKTPPSLSITSPSSGATIGDSKVTVSGSPTARTRRATWMQARTVTTPATRRSTPPMRSMISIAGSRCASLMGVAGPSCSGSSCRTGAWSHRARSRPGRSSGRRPVRHPTRLTNFARRRSGCLAIVPRSPTSRR